MALFSFGDVLVSAPFDLDLPRAAVGDPPLVSLSRVNAHAPRDWSSDRDDAAGGGLIQTWRSKTDAAFRLRFGFDDHAADFVIAPDGRTVELVATESTPEFHLAWLFEGPVLGRAVRMAGRPCLHATVLARGDRVIAVVGPSGAGKSTLAAALLSPEVSLLGDDMAIVEEVADGFVTYPGASRLRLWEDSLPHAEHAERQPVLPGVTSLPKLTVTIDRTRVDGPRRLDVVYRLAPRHAGDDVVMRPLPPPAASAVLAANIYGTLPHDPRRARAELVWAAALASSIPMVELSLPNDHAALSRLAGRLADDLFA